jgi:hypothetical protein
MRIAVVALGLVLSNAPALSQQRPTIDSSKDSQHSTGRKMIPENRAQRSPRATPARSIPSLARSGRSPQGQTPPGMQAAPEGSSKTIVDAPAKK